MTQPKDEPELADRKRWPKPGSSQWVARYQETKDLLEKLAATCPSTDARVRMLMVDLADACADDCKAHG